MNPPPRLRPHAANLFVACLCVPFLSTSVSADSANANDPVTLKEVVVTATSVEEPKQDVPASIQVVTSEDIKNSTAKDAGDLVIEAGVGHVTKYNGALTGSVQIRGLQTDLFSAYSSRVLILVNGSRAGTVNLAKIPAEDIERIEIVKGPASVIYGSSAMGGVVNIITKEGREGFHGSIGGEAGSWDYRKGGAEVSGKTGAFDYFATVSRESQGNYKAPDVGRIDNSGYKAETVSTRLGYSIAEGHHLSLGLQHWKGWDVGSIGATYSPDPDNYNNKKRDGYDLGYRTDTFNAKYYLVQDRDEWHGGMTSGPGNSDISKTDTDTQGASLQKTFLFGDHRVVLGGQWDQIKATSSRNTGAPYNPDSKYDSYGAFVEGRLGLLEKKLLVSAGLRYDEFRNEILPTPGIVGLVPRKDDIHHVTARGGLVYKCTDDLAVKMNLGTAFRAPAPLELAADYYSWGTHYVGNANLNPEKSTTYDIGVDYAKGVFKGDLTFFHTDFSDKIVSYYDTLAGVSTYRNTGEATIEGIEGNAAVDLGHALGMVIEPFVHATYHTKYEEKTGDTATKLLYTPQWTASVGVKVGQEDWDAQLLANYTGKELVTDWNYSSPTYGRTVPKGGFTVFSAKGSYRPLKNLEITLSVDNLLNRYYEYNLGYPMQGRTYVGGVKWLF